MSLPSKHEAHLIGDLVDEADKVYQFIGARTFEAFQADDMCIHSVEKALQNVTEACIQLNGKKKDGKRFEQLFPGHSFNDIRRLGNALRHDYGGLDITKLWDDIELFLPSLHKDAKAILAALRRAHGHP